MDQRKESNSKTVTFGRHAVAKNEVTEEKRVTFNEDEYTSSTNRSFGGDEPVQSSTLRGGQGGFGFSNKEIRRGFIAKVYSILFVQLAVTTAFIATFVFVDDVREWALRNHGVFLVAFAGYFGVSLVLVCCPNCRSHHPTNLIVLGVFTLCLSYIVSFISITYKTESVLLAFGICAVCTFMVSVFAVTTNIDFTRFAAYIFVSAICFMLFGMIMIFVRAPIAHKIYAGLGALLFMTYLIFDTQLLMGGRVHEISPDEYILAALVLYGDIIQIFLFILQLIGERRE